MTSGAKSHDKPDVRKLVLSRWPLLPITILLVAAAFATDIVEGNSIEQQKIIGRGILIALVVAAMAIGWQDILRISPSRAWAIATHTLRESVRRRVLLLIPAAMLLIAGVGLFQRSFDEVAAIRQTTEVCILVSSLLTLLIVIVLASFAFPREIESRTIYSLLTKPLTRLELFLGKLVGLAMVAALVLVIMGAFSYGYLRVKAIRLVGSANVHLADQRRDYAKAQTRRNQQAATTQPSRLAPALEPPDESLAQMIDVGLLAAMNWIEPSQPPELKPEPPTDWQVPQSARNAQWQWALSGHGYMALYPIDLTAARTPGRSLRISLSVLWPKGGSKDSLRTQVYIFMKALPETQIPLIRAPRGVAKAGWAYAVGEDYQLDLTRTEDGLFHGDLPLKGSLFQAMGEASRTVAIGIMPQGTGSVQQIAFAPTELLVTVLAPQPARSELLQPAKILMLPRVAYSGIFPLYGNNPGQPAEQITYTFDKLGQVALPEGELIFQLDLTRMEKGSPSTYPSHVLVTVYNPSLQKAMQDPETHDQEIKAYPSTRHGSYIHVPREFAVGDRLEIRIRTAHPDDVFQVTSQTVRLMGSPTPFALNLGKSLLICFAQATIAAALGLMASVFLSWPVALLLTLVLLVAGKLLVFVRGMVEHNSQIFVVREGQERSVQIASELGNTLIDTFSRILQHVIPDFARYDPAAYIGQGLNIPMLSILGDLGYALLCVVPIIALGYSILHFREVAR